MSASRAAAWWLLAALSAGCRRETSAWAADMSSLDPWRRRMAALALRSVEDGEVEATFRLLVFRMQDRSEDVTPVIQETLAVLAERRPDLPVKGLELLPPERNQARAAMARLLVEKCRAGDAAARASSGRRPSTTRSRAPGRRRGARR